jgi:DNA-directed RNA polymerase subunit RPC12/RpoP
MRLLGLLWREAVMEKIITCTTCRKTFKVSGPYSVIKQVAHGVTCPFCGEQNEVMWPMDTGLTTIPEKRNSV